jgi:NAD(P)-dependent dehydrogenase (short-subunit alcohol dehydrogenase family)
MANLLDLGGRRILVSGAASGIGRAIAEVASQQGASIIGVDRNAEGLQKVVASLSGSGHRAVVTDLTDTAAIQSWMLDAAADGTVSGLVHAAGLPCISPVRSLTPEVYSSVWKVNVEAAIAMTRAFQNRKVCGGEPGSVVFIASVMALVGSPGATGYSMTKGALTAMCRSMAVELASRRIRVNCIAPGFVRTPMLDRVGGGWDAAQQAAVEAAHPLGMGEAADVANAAAFLLSDASRWMTGSTLTIDGGYTAQ